MLPKIHNFFEKIIVIKYIKQYNFVIASMAQLVEQRIRNAWVEGSSPFRSFFVCPRHKGGFMTYENFKNELLSLLESHLPEEAELQVQPVLKNNNLTLDGLTIAIPSVNISPTIYLDYYYELYEDGKSMAEVCELVLNSYHTYRFEESVDLSFFNDYEKVKDHIIYKLINAGQNQELLSKIPFIPYLDLAIVFCCYLPSDFSPFNDEHSNGTILIHHAHMEHWKMTPLELLRVAKANTPSLLEPSIRPLSDFILENMAETERSAEIDEVDLAFPMYILTNQMQFLGATSLLYQGLLAKCGEILEDDFYIIPSSIHEVLLLPKGSLSARDFIDSMINDVNSTELKQEEVLSDHAYFYNRLTNQVSF